MRVVLLGNAGAGKSTLARRLVADRDIPRLSLDEIAWGEGSERLPLAASLALLKELLARHRALFAGFGGRKREYRRVADYALPPD